MDKHFKNKLKNHKVAWDKEDLLVGLEESLSQKQKRSKRIWLFLFLFGAGLTTSYLLYSTNSEEKTETTEYIKKSNSKVDHLEVEEYDQSASYTNKVIKPDVEIEKSTLLSDSHSINQAIEQNPKIDIKEIVNKSAAKDETEDEVNEIANGTFLKYRNDNATAKVNDRNIINQQKPYHPFNDANENLISNKSKNLKASVQKFIAGVQVKEEVANTNTPKIESISFYPRFLTPNDIPKLTLEKSELAYQTESESKKMSYFIEPHVGMGYLQRNFDSYLGETSEYLKEKMELETPIVYDVAGLNLGAVYDDKWTLQLGVEYQEMREKFLFEGALETDTTFIQYDKAFYYLDPNMDTIFVAGMAPMLVLQKRRVVHWNKHSYFSIPINVGRQFHFNKTSINTSIGLAYAIRHDFTGRTKRGLNRIVDNENYYFKNRLGLRFSVGTDFEISSNKFLFLNATFRKSPILNFGELYEKSHLSYSLGAGLRFYLN